MKIENIDIVDIKLKVKNNELKFFILDGYIYCKDNKSEECVIVGSYEELIFNSNGITIRDGGKSRPFGYTPDGVFHL